MSSKPSKTLRQRVGRLASVVCLTGIASLALHTAAGQAPTPADSAPTFQSSVKPFLTKNCFACHNPKARTADLSVQDLLSPESLAKEPDTWEKVIQKIRTGEMPPKGSPRPLPEAIAAITEHVESELLRIERAATPDPGSVTARRLNRAEYNNTVRDLLGVNLQAAARSVLGCSPPGDAPMG